MDDVGTELRDMRDELHKLMGVIESKDLAIETLENQLRTSKDEIKTKYGEFLTTKKPSPTNGPMMSLLIK